MLDEHGSLHFLCYCTLQRYVVWCSKLVAAPAHSKSQRASFSEKFTAQAAVIGCQRRDQLVYSAREIYRCNNRLFLIAEPCRHSKRKCKGQQEVKSSGARVNRTHLLAHSLTTATTFRGQDLRPLHCPRPRLSSEDPGGFLLSFNTNKLVWHHYPILHCV